MSVRVTRKPLLAALACGAALLASQPAAADFIKVSYAGVLTDVSGSLLADYFGAGNAPVVGGAFTGGFLFNRATVDANANPDIGFYSGGNSLFNVDFGLDGNGQQRRYEQDPALPYNQGEVGNDVSFNGWPQYDVWTAYGQLGNDKGYEYVETGMVLLSFLLSALGSDDVPTGLVDFEDFTYAGGCDPNGAGAAAGLSCARDMEFHAKKSRGGDPSNIYGDADIYGFITEMVIERLPDHRVPEPGSLALVLPALLGLRWAGRGRRQAG